MYEAEIAKLQEIIDDSENIVFFGGAGVRFVGFCDFI